MITLTQIASFIAAVDAGSMTRGAVALGVSQPTLSEQIQKLERELGVVLLLRSKQGLELTGAGTRFLPRARAVGDAVQEAEMSIRGVRDVQEGALSFGLFNSGAQVLSGLVPAFRTRYPGVSVRVVGANSAQVADLVRSGELEAGVVALPIDDRGLTLSDILWSCEAAYFHLDATAVSQPVTIEDIISRPLVLQEASWSDVDPTRRQLAERAQTRALQIRPDIEVESSAAALAIAASGLAGAVVSVPVAEVLGYTRTLHWTNLEPPLVETFAVITREPRSLSPATRAMLDLVHQHMRMLHDEFVSPDHE